MVMQLELKHDKRFNIDEELRKQLCLFAACDIERGESFKQTAMNLVDKVVENLPDDLREKVANRISNPMNNPMLVVHSELGLDVYSIIKKVIG